MTFEFEFKLTFELGDDLILSIYNLVVISEFNYINYVRFIYISQLTQATLRMISVMVVHCFQSFSLVFALAQVILALMAAAYLFSDDSALMHYIITFCLAAALVIFR